MLRLFNPHLLHPHLLLKLHLVLPPNLPPLIMPSSTTFRSIHEEQVSLRTYAASENAAPRDVVQEQHDELRDMLATQTPYFCDYKACLET